MARYVALLRGINVGGNNIIKMADLRACLEEAGYTDVATLIQSGNIVFGSGTDQKALAPALAELLSKTFGYDATLVVRNRRQMADVIAKAPKGFGSKPDAYRYDVMFLLDPLTAAKALPQLPTTDGVDVATAGPGVVYFTRLVSQITRSRLNKIVGTPIYRSVTIRNWNTTTKLETLVRT